MKNSFPASDRKRRGRVFSIVYDGKERFARYQSTFQRSFPFFRKGPPGARWLARHKPRYGHENVNDAGIMARVRPITQFVEHF